MIALLLVGSAVLGYLIMGQKKVIDELSAALEPGGEIESLAEDILGYSHLYTAYKERSAREGVKDNDEKGVQTYVREIAQRPRVMWGNVRIPNPTERQRLQGYNDRAYRLTPQEKGMAFDRPRIANFMYLLEFESRKLRVTNIDLKVAERVDKHEVPEDKWAVDLTVTMRERIKK
ncbi:MAG: hypothetical protein AAGB93_03585 [Planctomycetota bacterium]